MDLIQLTITFYKFFLVFFLFLIVNPKKWLVSLPQTEALTHQIL